MTADLYVAALEEALALHGKPDICNTQQGSQFTGTAFTSVLHDAGIQISMDGRGAWRDNVFVERLWRSVKYEEIHLRAYDSVSEARASIGRYLTFYNGTRPHSAHGGQTPTKHTSTRQGRSRPRHNQRGNPLNNGHHAVQTSGTTSCAMAAVRLRHAPPPVTHGAGGPMI